MQSQVPRGVPEHFAVLSLVFSLGHTEFFLLLEVLTGISGDE